MIKVAEHETLQDVAEKHAAGKISNVEVERRIESIVDRAVREESILRVAFRELFPSLINTGKAR